ncbi:hypothetical protein [Paenibacillus mucilaginosus]|uniref:hypothetical protein n=1 Tax=Paenibacillus mucilaginosus TaxID=61624 RepID=UPI001F179ECC|nr:hypothetical protein [Paenibacillus mucilaginosus]
MKVSFAKERVQVAVLILAEVRIVGVRNGCRNHLIDEGGDLIRPILFDCSRFGIYEEYPVDVRYVTVLS